MGSTWRSPSLSMARQVQRGISARIRNAAAPTTTTLVAQIPTSQESFFTMAQWYPAPISTLPRNSQ